MYNFYNRMVNKLFAGIVECLLRNAAKRLSPRAALGLLLNHDNVLYRYISQCAIRYDNGLHPKHRLIAYHDYFVKNIAPGENVLDIGCGNGALSYDVAQKIKGRVIGVDKNQANINYARQHYNCDNLEFIQGDILLGLPDRGVPIDTVIMSNLIEHIEKRVEFLQGVLAQIKPNKVLFRVPMYEREWLVPLKEELGVEYRLDQTHYIEYAQEDFFAELKAAGLMIESFEVRWGEIWARTLPGR